MKKYLQELGYKFTTKNDLKDRQFRHVNDDIEKDEELSVLGKTRHLISSEWELRLPNYDLIKASNQISSIIDKSHADPLFPSDNLYPSMNLFPSGDEVYFISDYSITTENQEKSTLLNITFIIKGL